jgi:hypothetical protein
MSERELKPTAPRYPFLVGAAKKVRETLEALGAAEAGLTGSTDPVLPKVYDFLGANSVADTLDRLGYGERLTKGASCGRCG